MFCAPNLFKIILFLTGLGSSIFLVVALPRCGQAKKYDDPCKSVAKEIQNEN
jgi:hypothetical protein